MKPTVDVVGISCDDSSVFSGAAIDALIRADLIIGSARQLSLVQSCVGGLKAKPINYPNPLNEIRTLLDNTKAAHIAFLASGDPLFFGLGGMLSQFVQQNVIRFHPSVSSIQCAFARIGMVWTDAHIVSLHGRSLSTLNARLQANRVYGILTDTINTPQQIALQLIAAGFDESTVWVAQDLAASTESILKFDPAELAGIQQEFSSLNVVIVETRGKGGWLPEFPGIPDQFFITEEENNRAMLSKREVRLSILSLLSPKAREIGWDIGAGCGGVCIEWTRWNRRSQVYAVECHSHRLDLLVQNREKFGVVQNLEIIEGAAPEVLAELPDPHAVFVGGSRGRLEQILAYTWDRLIECGRLVASAVTEDSRSILYRFADVVHAHEEWSEISVRRCERLAGNRVLRPQLPVLLMKLTKHNS